MYAQSRLQLKEDMIMMLIPRNYGLNLFDDIFNDSFFSNTPDKKEEVKKLPIMRTDIRERDGNYILEIELPGFKKDEIQAELKDGYLTISALANSQEDAAKGKLLHQERFNASCKRSFFVGEELRQEDIKASFENGLLTLSIPKETPKVEENPKYINIL